MAHKNKVMRSINFDGETVCVDIFLRPDGTYGFDEFRRDMEDNQGWFSIGRYGHQTFETMDSALVEAQKSVGWLSDVLKSE